MVQSCRAEQVLRRRAERAFQHDSLIACEGHPGIRGKTEGVRLRASEIISCS